MNLNNSRVTEYKYTGSAEALQMGIFFRFVRSVTGYLAVDRETG